jgi:hypothetical protein
MGWLSMFSYYIKIALDYSSVFLKCITKHKNPHDISKQGHSTFQKAPIILFFLMTPNGYSLHITPKS